MAKFTLKQDVISSDPKDAAMPYGYIFGIRYGCYRVIFDNNTIRDVPEEYLEAVNWGGLEAYQGE